MNFIIRRSTILLVSILLILSMKNGFTQEATISEESRKIKTYPFFDPDPVATQGIQAKIYPYFRFDGYSHDGIDQEWKVIRMENPYIRLYVLPQVGGKIWGAIEKSTGNEFIYLNSVLKFRDIAMRGAWTSGGIEFNFGLIGHAPTTATPVDYLVKENDDGSKSCIFGALDLSSRTQWRVTITIPQDKAYFKTHLMWYNPTPFHTSYYHWMNGAFQAENGFQLFYPGQYTIGHNGQAHPWSVDENGRDLSYYKNNDFGGSKSYHVVGTYEEFSGGYWHDLNFGFGHWALYDDLPGQKYFMWSMARQGAIWEDLLTDTDGQYVEIQMGRLFNQANLTSGFESPFTQVFFPSYTTDRWDGIWYPVKEIGGITASSPYAVMHIEQKNDSLQVGFNFLQHVNDSLIITSNRDTLFAKRIKAKPMEVFNVSVSFPASSNPLTVKLGDDKLFYSSVEDETKLSRPVTSDKKLDPSSAESLFQRGEEYAKIRQNSEALKWYQKCLDKEPLHSRALNRVAEIYARRADFETALLYVDKVLEYNTYDADANYLYGVIQRKLGNLVDAKEAFGWAARSMQYRSAAYTQIAEIYLQENHFKRAEIYSNRALNYDNNNIPVNQVLAICNRKQDRIEQAEKILNHLLQIDPLNHFARFELSLLSPQKGTTEQFTNLIRNELPQETYLELAITYVNLGLKTEALQVLRLAPPHPMVYYWCAYLMKDQNKPDVMNSYLMKAQEMSSYLIFPFRQESIAVLKWAKQQMPHWKNNYYLGLIYWSEDRSEDALQLFNHCSNEPDAASFYLARGNLKEQIGEINILEDYKKAVDLNANEWRTWFNLNRYYLEQSQFKNALAISEQAFNKFPDHFIIGMNYAETLLLNDRYDECLSVLKNIHVLPYEGARAGHEIYEQANIFSALEHIEKNQIEKAIQLLQQSILWPENLGVGAPFYPDTRLQDYLEAYCYRKIGETERADQANQRIKDYTIKHWTDEGWNHYIGGLVLEELNEKQKADQLMRDWTGSQGEDFYLAQTSKNPLVEWAKAKWNGDDAEVRRIENEVLQQNHFQRRGSRNFITLLKVMKFLDSTR